ncbi:MAG: TIGR04283 family arsenosugar biosynthesis glycosyltransferase [Mariprofundales bacterium]|nr:TIGR04283 family arsenosugar biosynthesis glycosyltransferase [Mariprofundales bacterium]
MTKCATADHISIAVVIPLLNEEVVLPALLTMVRELPVDEVVLVDGGSSDNSCALLSQSGLRWIRAPAGRAIQMNTGAALCCSDTLLFLHADSHITADAIHELRHTLQRRSILSGYFRVALDSGAWYFKLITFMINLRSRISRVSTGDQGQFIRRELFNRVGGFPNQPLMEDIELSKTVKQLGRVACLNGVVTTSCRRWQQHGVIRTTLLMWWLRWRYWLGASPARLAHEYRQVR